MAFRIQYRGLEIAADTAEDVSALVAYLFKESVAPLPGNEPPPPVRRTEAGRPPQTIPRKIEWEKTEELMEHISRLTNEGQTAREIAEATGVSIPYVYQLRKKIMWQAANSNGSSLGTASPSGDSR